MRFRLSDTMVDLSSACMRASRLNVVSVVKLFGMMFSAFINCPASNWVVMLISSLSTRMRRPSLHERKVIVPASASCAIARRALDGTTMSVPLWEYHRASVVICASL